MNDKITISTAQLLALFPNEATARHYIESRRWPNGPRCPVCASDRIGAHSPGIYRCNACDEPLTVRTGTVMERSKIPLVKWLHAMYLLVTSRKGISSMQLSKELSITQKSAWFLLQRLREACARLAVPFRGQNSAARFTLPALTLRRYWPDGLGHSAYIHLWRSA